MSSRCSRSCWVGHPTRVPAGVRPGVCPTQLAGRFCTTLVPVPKSTVGWVPLSVPYPNDPVPYPSRPWRCFRRQDASLGVCTLPCVEENPHRKIGREGALYTCRARYKTAVFFFFTPGRLQCVLVQQQESSNLDRAPVLAR